MILGNNSFNQSNSLSVADTGVELQSIQSLLDCVTDAVFWVKPNAQIVHANLSAHCLFKASLNTSQSPTVYDLNLGFSAETWLKRWQAVQHNGSLFFNASYQSNENQRVIVGVKLVALNDEHACIIVSDRTPAPTTFKNLNFNFSAGEANACNLSRHLSCEIREQNWTEDQFKASISLLQATIEAVDLGIVAVSNQEKIVGFNQKFVQLWQVSNAIMDSKDCYQLQSFIQRQLKHPETFQMVGVSSNASPLKEYDTLELASGRIFEYYVKPQYQDGQILGNVLSFCDITERREIEAALQQSEAKFRTLAETTDAIVFITQGNHFCYVNPAAESITGYCREELLSCPNIREFIQEQGQVNLQDFSSQAEVKHCQEIKILTKAGQECWLDCAVGVIEFAGKLAVLGTAIDITKRKQAEVEIKQALQQEKELSDLRGRFIHIVSHEFRTPLNSIALAASSLIRYSNRWAESEKLEYLHGINTDIQQLSQLLDEVLTFSQVETENFRFKPKPLNLEHFCTKLVKEMQIIDGNQHGFSFTSQGNCSNSYIDEKLLRPIFTNLFFNAMKYSAKDSSIDLDVFCQSEAVIFEVRDEGIGIPSGDLPHLFELFHRGSNVGNVSGTGLGLAVVKKLVNLQRGRIEVTSEVDVGTTFRVTLPLLQTSELEEALLLPSCLQISHA
jgi:PAS domain S-box-containing protein